MRLRQNSDAFTLMELMVSVLILLLVIVGLLATLIHCLLLNETNYNSAVATNDAQYVLEQVKALAYSNISSYAPPTISHLSKPAGVPRL